MTRHITLTELTDFRAVVVRCKQCGSAMSFGLGASIRFIVECQGCGARLELKPILPLLEGLKQAQGGNVTGFDIEFETAEA